MERKRIYGCLNVTDSWIERDSCGIRLHVHNRVFKTDYDNWIPIQITDDQFDTLLNSKKALYCDAKKRTPILFEIKKQANKWCREHLSKTI